MAKGKFEEELVLPYLPSKIVPPEFIRDVLNEADGEFPSADFELEVPHKWPLEEYKDKFEELEQLMIEILTWRKKWFGSQEKDKK